ncbi:SMP-30/gluconolactonase/LRE family protein [Occallatibacter riparius]|uniref:SMP-30/gluconolactonase/LRE family protein n=1 Tax=Occallatibacter riparius TaxID=1002689 RepID=A0A9J7BS59_9BACT|nr:SMP-30/gluconolactonase/LRE family protein [Occallatibacter riparius]UWZ85415.1 SMP-30/gluconolactonase/LRE family protein [Occallatibacter riparius]
MLRTSLNPTRTRRSAILLLLAALALIIPFTARAEKKKKANAASPAVVEGPRKFPFDPKKLAWPSPPNVARIKWLDYFAGSKIDYSAQTTKPKASWMDRLAGGQTDQEKASTKNFPFQLIGPYGIAVDSKGLVYTADQKVGAVFIFNPETHDTEMIRNGYEAHFGWINGVAIDDDDRLFVSDGKARRILIFSPKHELEGQIAEGLVDPVGLAIDTTNRLLYVVDTQQDQVVVYDADSHKLLRRIGTAGKNHFLTTPGDFGAPQGVAVDSDGNVYVTDTLNNRVEIFDADGNFISTFGKAGDGPGYFARPKGIAVDSDGHIWVADEMQDRLQIFNREGQLLTFIGQGHGELPGQFKALVGVAVDSKNNRVYTAEQYPGRLQMFRYVTDTEAAAEKAKHEEDQQKGSQHHQKAAPASPAKPDTTAAEKPAAPAPATPSAPPNQ